MDLQLSLEMKQAKSDAQLQGGHVFQCSVQVWSREAKEKGRKRWEPTVLEKIDVVQSLSRV